MHDHPGTLILNPRPPDWYCWHLCDAHSYLPRYEQGAGDPARGMGDSSLAQRLQAVAHAYLGDIEAGKVQARLILRDQPGFTIGEWAKRPPLPPQ